MSNMVIVCSECHSESCAKGELMCENARNAIFLTVHRDLHEEPLMDNSKLNEEKGLVNRIKKNKKSYCGGDGLSEKKCAEFMRDLIKYFELHTLAKLNEGAVGEGELITPELFTIHDKTVYKNARTGEPVVTYKHPLEQENEQLQAKVEELEGELEEHKNAIKKAEHISNDRLQQLTTMKERVGEAVEKLRRIERCTIHDSLNGTSVRNALTILNF